jgi:hypothetical protein
MRLLTVANLALLLAVAALAAVVYFGSPPGQSMTLSLSTREPALATLIRIEHSGRPVITIEKTAEVWRLTTPLKAEADAVQVQRVLSVLTARSPQRFPATRLERFELDRPRLKLLIDDQMFAFGLVSALSGEQYLLTRDAVYIVEPRYGSMLAADPLEFARRQLLSSNETPLRFEMETFTVEERDGKWRLAPASEVLSQDDLARWVSNWRLASALRVEAYVPAPTNETVTVGLKAGTPIRLAIVQRAPELVIGREDEGLQYRFPAALAQRLLRAPTVARDDRTTQK